VKIHRFIGNFALSKGEIILSDKEIVDQIRKVLKLEVGEKVELSDGKGVVAEAEIVSISKNEIVCLIHEVREVLRNTQNVHLYLAILKKENFELAVQKAVECGVSLITPVISERTIKTGLNIERLEKIIKEASEQSGSSMLAKLNPITKFEDAVQGSKEELKIIFDLRGDEYKPSKDDAAIFIGPEGGFTETEITLAKNAGFSVASLGPLTLRGETAAIVATYRAVQGI